MLVSIYKSKIHRATVTDCNLNYVGSISIDSELMKRANLFENEKVQVANINNGERFETYVIKGEPNSGIIQINGAATHKVSKGDLIIIIAYGLMEQKEVANFKPAIVHVDENNRPTG